jgi:hypothetical protein
MIYQCSEVNCLNTLGNQTESTDLKSTFMIVKKQIHKIRPKEKEKFLLDIWILGMTVAITESAI